MQQKDYRRSEGLPTDGKEGWGEGIFFAQMLSPSVMMKARGSERGKAFSLIQKLS